MDIDVSHDKRPDPASGSDTAVAACLQALEARIPGSVRSDAYQRMLYATDASIYQVDPLAVVIPKHRDEVQVVVETAAEHGVPVLARAAGSSLAGQAVGRAIIVDFTKYLDVIEHIDLEARTVRCQPGVVLDRLNAELHPYGLQFGPDPASSNRAAMGGIVSNNSTGSHSIAYGMTADWVRSADVVLNDGSRASFGEMSPKEVFGRAQLGGREGDIVRDLLALTTDETNRRVVREHTPRHWRRCGGYNLDRLIRDGISFRVPQDDGFNPAKLICGAEGTLAIIESLELGLVPVPSATALGIVHFDSLQKGLEAVPIILETDPTAVELLDHLGMSMCRKSPMWRRKLEQFVDGDPRCVLITEYAGSTQEEVRSRVDALSDHLNRRSAGAETVVPVASTSGQKDVWSVRKMGLGFLMSVRGDHKPIPFIEDSAVPVEHLSDYVLGVERFIRNLGLDVAYYAHASAGCVHIRPLVNTKAAAEIARMPEIVSFAVEQLKGFGGALSSEHGDGRARSAFNAAFFGPELYGLYCNVKGIFDPSCLFNPGNIVDAGPMTENLRYGPDYTFQSLRTKLDFSADEGFDQAVEMCNGAGVCRKLGAGTMCPSFMATREEEHSTRGRANALRAVLSGHLPQAELTGKRLYETMDLCLQCKACAAECPSSVDMARLKVEFLAQYYAANGTPRRARFFASAATHARRWSGRMAGTVNRLNRMPWVRAGMRRFLGIAPERTLPPFAREPFDAWFANRKPTPSSAAVGTRGRVVLFNDTFNTYHYPEVAIAATRVLETLGFEVVLPGHGCCGRPMISKGLVDEARKAASEVLDRLVPFARKGLPIIGLEPSCVLSFGDEYPALLPGDPRVPLVAEQTLLFDEFIAALVDEAPEGAFPDVMGPARALLHGHCHQKSSVGTSATHRMLAIAGAADVSEVDSGCCGMAGSFGFESEHFDLSMAIGEQRLMPAVRGQSEDTVIVAPGVSCRQQIEQGTRRRAFHPAEVLWRSMLDASMKGARNP